MERPPVRGTLASRLTGVLFGFLAMALLAGLVYYGLGWIKTAFPDMTFRAAAGLFLLAYIILLFIAARRPDLTEDDPENPPTVLPRPWDVAATGLYFVLPIIVLIWCILIERLSPTLSAYWATIAMIVIVFTQHPLKQCMRFNGGIFKAIKQGGQDFFDGMIGGARNMIGIGAVSYTHLTLPTNREV